MANSPSTSSSAVPKAGFLRHRFVFEKGKHRKFEDFEPASRMRSGRVFGPAGELLAEVDDSSPARVVVSFGEDEYMLLPRGRKGGRIRSPTGECLAEIAPSKRAVLAKFSPLVIVPVLLLTQCTGIVSAFPLLSTMLLLGFMAFMIILMSADGTARVSAGGMAWKVTEGLGVGDYRVDAGGQRVLQVFRDNGRTFDDYDVDVSQGVDARLVLLMAVAFHFFFPDCVVPGEYRTARGIAQRGPRPEHP